MNDALLANARLCLARGWLPTPLDGKIPLLTAWQKQDPPTDGMLCKWVYEGRNLGVRTGSMSGNLIVVDVDPGCMQAIQDKLAAIHTPTVRTGRGLHYYFKGKARCSAGKISDNLDVRGEGGQVVMPGSLHPDTGEPYTWVVHPDEAQLAEYPPWLEQMADDAEKLRNAPEGKRNATLNKVAFTTAKAGGHAEELADAAVEVGLEANEIRATIKSGATAGQKFIQSMSVDNEIMVPGEHFLNGGESVTVNTTDFVRMCWRRIERNRFFTRLGATGEISDATFDPCSVTRFRYLVSEQLNLCAYVKSGRSFQRENRTLTPDLGALILSAGREFTPELRAIVKYPLAGGEHKGWVNLFDGEIDTSVTDHRLFWETVLCDFPFAKIHDLYGYVAFLLTMHMRPVIDGPVPLFYIGASQPRTGKTKLLTEVAAKIVYGRHISNIALGDDDAEIDKRLNARASGGHTIFSFDNVHGKVNSSVLAAFITSRMYGGRILGQSKMVEFINDAVTVLTGNNISMSEELAKRTWRIMLESKEEHPEARTEFVHNPLGPYLDSIRPKALGSLMAIAKMVGNGVTLGGCEEWGRLVGGAMEAAGMPLSQEGFGNWVEQADDASADLLSLVKHWIEFGGQQRVNLKAILGWVKTLEIMPYVLDCDREHSQLIRLGKKIHEASGRVLAGHQIQSAGSGTRRMWFLVPV